MGFFKRSIFIMLSVLFFAFCKSNRQKQMNFPQEIAKAYYETLALDSQRQAVGINFYLEFKEPLSEELHLQKIHFRNHDAIIEKVSSKKYVSHFPQTAVIQDYILDGDGKKEYGNKAPIIVKPQFKLNKDEAVLEYQMNNDTIFFKLTGINEKQ